MGNFLEKWSIANVLTRSITSGIVDSFDLSAFFDRCLPLDPARMHSIPRFSIAADSMLSVCIVESFDLKLDVAQ